MPIGPTLDIFLLQFKRPLDNETRFKTQTIVATGYLRHGRAVSI
jgi:hypothetical protein